MGRKCKIRCSALFDEYLNNLAVAIANIHIALDCDIVIGGEITGGLRGRMDKLLQLLKREDSSNDCTDYLSLAIFGGSGDAIGVAILQSMVYLTK